jgi:hypothetical protein
VRRATPKHRRQLDEAQADAVVGRREGTLRAAMEMVHQITGLAVRETDPASPTTWELLVEVPFGGVRSGRMVLGFSRGLTRQVGMAMGEMVDLDGRPLSTVDAAKELASAVAHAVLLAGFSVDARPRLQSPRAMTPVPLEGDVVVLGVADGVLAVSLLLDQSQL